MINERGGHIWRPMMANLVIFLRRTMDLRSGSKKVAANMTSALTALAIAVSGTSLICFVLMTRAERSRNRRKTSADGGSDVGTYAGDDSGSHFWSWFGSDHASGATAPLAATVAEAATAVVGTVVGAINVLPP
jgi:hypothetical protein